MTIGEKIKYLRTRIGITQGKLADLSGIHPVSIRKYETNKMTPQPAQISKIADALGSSHFALSDISELLKLETVGDFVGMFINFIKAGIIIPNGARNSYGLLNIDTATFEINSSIAKFFCISDSKTDLSGLQFKLKDETILNSILTWEVSYYRYNIKCKELEGVTDPVPLGYLKEFKDTLEELELELTRPNRMLDTSDGILVKLPPDWFN